MIVPISPESCGPGQRGGMTASPSWPAPHSGTNRSRQGLPTGSSPSQVRATLLVGSNSSLVIGHRAQRIAERLGVRGAQAGPFFQSGGQVAADVARVRGRLRDLSLAFDGDADIAQRHRSSTRLRPGVGQGALLPLSSRGTAKPGPSPAGRRPPPNRAPVAPAGTTPQVPQRQAFRNAPFIGQGQRGQGQRGV